MFEGEIGQGHDTGRGSQNQEEPGPRETPHRPTHERVDGRQRQAANHHEPRQDVTDGPRHGPVVIQHQRIGPKRQPQIMQDHAGLAGRVLDPRDGQSVAGPPGAAIGEEEEQGEGGPCGQQPEIHAATPLPGLAERPRQKCPIVQKDHQRCGDGHLLAAHRQQRRRGCGRGPARADEATCRSEGPRRALPDRTTPSSIRSAERRRSPRRFAVGAASRRAPQPRPAESMRRRIAV